MQKWKYVLQQYAKEKSCNKFDESLPLLVNPLSFKEYLISILGGDADTCAYETAIVAFP